ncbi:GlcNAc-PI de-N-acetylase [Pustulibacterium marinum]|uniref:GlcNAc-PI de-N-acetylase n=1 Tax=Pustulibacterium marinum TaxID=1224947 RepID=A0A1I7FTN5_9FLAO|nr:PIG-L family deacetylase [Pustulibacterium marinum]SFU39579.1 GlcNAc-PI de-N-acetylase [Pustulibacterium marinum]
MRKILAIVISFTFTSLSFAQKPTTYNASEIYEQIQKLNFLGTALYVAAHPDDENTALIAYLSNHTKARTGYLSLTRGDGGQNLIGTELRELLGVLRTEELLAARRVDGGEQFFSRANDFGYSKHPSETLEFWNEDDVLADVVWTMRNFKPDIIINRFDHRTPGTTHGHHTTSAILSVTAFDKVNDPKAFPDQLQYTETWQPKRMFFNTNWWFYGSKEAFDKADKSKMISVDDGVYYPLKGKSNGEIAGLSRSQHRCQGFGTAGTRGSNTEYLELIKGEMPSNEEDLFSGINTTWTRVKGGKAIGNILENVEANFNFSHPETHVSELLKAYKLIQNLEDSYWRTYKSNEIKQIIQACCGLYIQANSVNASVTPGNSATIQLEITNRSHQNIVLQNVAIDKDNQAKTFQKSLPYNQENTFDFSVTIPKNSAYSTPYWLMEEGTLGMYKVDKQKLIGKPETPAPVNATISLLIDDTPITFTKSVVYKKVYPDKGETFEPFHILPEVTASIAKDVIIFSNSDTQEIEVTVRAGKDHTEGVVSLSIPKEWEVFPKEIAFSINEKNDIQQLKFSVTPPKQESVGSVQPIVTINNQQYDKKLVTIDYDHIPKQSVLLPATSKIVRLNIDKAGEHIGYIAGAGDKIPESLQEIGYFVSIIDPELITEGNLSQYDAIVIGIRAYNTVNTLPYKQQFLESYVKNGGTVIAQYNTNRRLLTDHLTPYKMSLSYDRVTDENATVTFLEKDSPILNFPNKITQKDFDGWTQERGLYFPNSWDEAFTPILSMHDKGEEAKKGSLLVAKYGEGYYIYTGLSFFRELPAGVPGAFKLFTNLISVGKSELPKDKIKG